MANVVVYRQRGVQLRDPIGRYAPKIVPPAKAVQAGPLGQTRPNVVPVTTEQRPRGQGVVQRPADADSSGRTVVGPGPKA